MPKRFDLNDVRTFVFAAKYGSLTGAAEELGLPASTISRSLTRLEDHLSILLVRRTPNGLILTDAGKRYLVSCKGALRSLREGSEDLEGSRANPAGLLRIGAPICLAKNTLSPLLGAFLKRCPNLQIEVDVYASGWDKEPEEHVDIYFKVRTPRDSTKRFRAYPEIRQGIFASPQYLAEYGTPDHPSALEGHKCITMLPEGNFELWKLSSDGVSCTPDTERVVLASDPEMHAELALAGAGVAVLPLWLATRPSLGGKLTRILLPWEPPSITLSALYSGASRLTPKVEAFLTYIGPFIGTHRDPCLHGALAEDCFRSLRR